MAQIELSVELPAGPTERARALATLLGAAAVLSAEGTDAQWVEAELPQSGVVTVPGNRNVPCQVRIAGATLVLTVDAGSGSHPADPRVPLWLDAVSRRIGLPASVRSSSAD